MSQQAKMPRISPEARAAAAFRTGAKFPKPPKVLPPRARRIWQEIVSAAAPDRYIGHEHALRGYCQAVEMRERIGEALIAARPGTVEAARLAKAFKQFSDTASREGRQLRLFLSSRLDRKSGILDEKGPALVVDNQRDDRINLIGGRAISARWD
jgi:hypothetical protein